MRDRVDNFVTENRHNQWAPPISTLLVIQKKWKPAIIYQLMQAGPLRFSKLRQSIDSISKKALSNCLKELEQDNIVERTVVSERPHKVEYSLSELGETLEPVIREMETWSNEHLQDRTTAHAAAK